MIVYFCLILWERLIAPYMIIKLRQLLGHPELQAELPKVATNEALDEYDEDINEVEDSMEEYCVTSTSRSVSFLNENKKDLFDVTLENISIFGVDDTREKEEEVLCREEDNRPMHEINVLEVEDGFEGKVEASDDECDFATDSTFDDGMKSEFNRNDIQAKKALAESLEHTYGGLVDANRHDTGVNAAINDEIRSAALPEKEVIEVVTADSENETSELNNSQVSNETTASAIRSVLTESVFRRSLECQYGLLDQLLQNECLTMENIRYLREGFNTERERVNKLLKFIHSSNISKFEEGLGASNQNHLVNFIRKKGIRESPEDTEWPVSDSDTAPIINFYADLVRDIDHKSLVDHLFTRKCLNLQQQENISTEGVTNMDKNRKLLDIVIRRSVRQLDIFYQCLQFDHSDIWNQMFPAQGERVFAVDLDIESDNLAQYLDEFKEKKQEILRRADDPALEVDLRQVSGRIYMIAKTEVGEEMRSDTFRPSRQAAETLVDNVQKTLREVLRNDDRNGGNIKSGKVVTSEKKCSGRIQFTVGLTDDGSILKQKIFKISLDKPDIINVINSTPTSIKFGSAACVVNNALYAVGIGRAQKELWKWSASRDEWTRCADMPSGRRRHCVTSVSDKIYVLGGWINAEKKAVDSILCYDINSNDWTQAGELRHAVESSACATYKHYAYVFGGADKENKTANYVQIYDTVTGSVSLGSNPMPRAHYLMRAVVWRTKALLIGSDTCLMYDFEFNTWQERKKFKTDLWHFGLTLDDNILYISGGEKRSSAGVGTETDKVKSLPVDDFILDNKEAEWKHHATLPAYSLIYLCNNVTLLNKTMDLSRNPSLISFREMKLTLTSALAFFRKNKTN